MFQTAMIRTCLRLLVLCLVVLTSSGSVTRVWGSEPNFKGYPRLMQGPMLGAVSHDEIKIWARASGEYPVSVEWGTDFELKSSVETERVVASALDDFTVVIAVQGLDPDTEYFYRPLVNGERDRYLKKHPPFRVKTAPTPGTDHDFRIAFGSGSRFQDDRVQRVWSAVQAVEPDLFFWVGDNIYGDSLNPHVLQEEYRRQRDVASLQPVLRSVSHLAVWDDHDYGMNNQDRRNPIKEEALKIFEDYWANPSYGLPDTPGIFFRYSYGQVDFFFLDDRYYRDPDPAPQTPDKTMLGAAQRVWLESELEASTAVFKVLVSGGGWSEAKGVTGDSWAAFVDERNRIFERALDF